MTYPARIHRRGACVGRPVLNRVVWFILAASASLSAGAQPGPAANSETARSPASDIDDSLLSIRGIFNSMLPGTVRKDALRFTLRPHVGDLLHRDFLRVPVGLRYGVTKNWELSTETTAFFSHGLGDDKFFDHSGFADVRFGTKYNFRERLRAGWETAVGFDYYHPVGHPPPDVTDGLIHASPYVTFSHRLESAPAWRVFWGFGFDLVEPTSVRGRLNEDDLGEDANTFTTGFVWDRGPLHYTFEANYATTALLGERDRDLLSLRPGVLWEVPTRWRPFGIGHWVVGAGLRATFAEGGTDLGASMKLRVDANLKQWWRATFGRNSTRP